MKGGGSEAFGNRGPKRVLEVGEGQPREVWGGPAGRRDASGRAPVELLGR